VSFVWKVRYQRYARRRVMPVQISGKTCDFDGVCQGKRGGEKVHSEINKKRGMRVEQQDKCADQSGRRTRPSISSLHSLKRAIACR
jgi:hypothetical protein